MKTFGSRASRVMWIGALVCLLTRLEPVQGQAQTPLHRVRTAGLDSAVVGRVTAFFAPADGAHAIDLAALLDRAANSFEREFGGSFPLYLAVLRPTTVSTGAKLHRITGENCTLGDLFAGWCSERLR